jgi:hypothetical protein
MLGTFRVSFANAFRSNWSRCRALEFFLEGGLFRLIVWIRIVSLFAKCANFWPINMSTEIVGASPKNSATRMYEWNPTSKPFANQEYAGDFLRKNIVNYKVKRLIIKLIQGLTGTVQLT